jgi:uncharacterized protein YdbL (DUF1318 family)
MNGPVRVGRLVAILVVLLAVPHALAQGDSEEALKRRIDQRAPELARLEHAGRVGETWQGYVEAVVPVYLDDAPTRRIVNEENADRKAVYRLIADEINAELPADSKKRVTLEAVARRNAVRKFESARPDEYLKVAGSTWIQKQGEPRYRRLLELKEQGKVGETWQGFVMAVTPAAAADRPIAKLIDQENAARRKRYEQLAELLKRTPDEIAREKAKGYFKDARPGDFLRTADGQWMRRKDLPPADS